MKASTIKIIKSDYLSTISFIAPIVMILLFFDSKYFGLLSLLISRERSDVRVDSSFFLVMTILFASIFLPLLLLRIRSINNHFKSGFEVVGKIIYLYMWRDRCVVEYEYEIDGEKYSSGNTLHRNKVVSSLVIGEEISIIVSRNNHKKAFIKELFEAG